VLVPSELKLQRNLKKRDIMEKKQSFNNYKTAVEKELNKLYSDSKRNQKLLKETEIYLHFLYENNYSSSEAVVAIVSGL